MHTQHLQSFVTDCIVISLCTGFQFTICLLFCFRVSTFDLRNISLSGESDIMTFVQTVT